MRVGNSVDGYHMWCVPDWDWDQGLYWQLFQVYMMLVVLVLPSLVMMFAYSAISNEVFSLVKRRNVMTNMLTDQMQMSSISPSSSFRNSKAIKTRDLEGNTIKTPTVKAVRHNSSLLLQKKQKRMSEKSHMARIIPMLVLVVIIFIICWAPLLIFNVLQAFNIIPTQLFDNLKHLKTGLSLLAYFNR